MVGVATDGAGRRALNATDPRGQDAEKMTNLRSINLNISARGLEALRSVDPSLGQ